MPSTQTSRYAWVSIVVSILSQIALPAFGGDDWKKIDNIRVIASVLALFLGMAAMRPGFKRAVAIFAISFASLMIAFSVLCPTL